MLILIFKIVLCSSLLIGIYYLFYNGKDVSVQQILSFVCFGFSYAIPFVKINLPAVSQRKNQLIFEEIPTQQLIQKAHHTSQFDWINLILTASVLISILLIIKSIISIKKIINLKGTDINYQNQKVKLVEKICLHLVLE